MRAQEFNNYWMPFAYENDIVVVYPQTTGCWYDEKPEAGTTQFTNKGAHNQYMKAIVDRVKSP